MVMLTRIDPSGLTSNRLDPTYYRPEHLRDAQLRGAWTRSNLDELRSPTAPIVYGVLKPDDQGEKFRVAKAERFEGMFISAEDCDPISEQMFNEFGRAEAIDGDLLVAIGGYVGRPALLRAHDGLRVVVNRHLARVRIDRVRADSGWVLAYFSSARGERQLTREITGSVQAGINLCDLRLVDVPLPSVEAQRFVGDKVRQAERLRGRARRLEAESSAFFQLSEWTEARAGTRRAYTARRSVMRSERLDSPFYDPGHEDLDSLLRRRGYIELNEVASLNESRWPRGGDKFSYFEIGELDIASGILSPTTTEVVGAPSRAQTLVEPWDVLVSTVRPNRKNVGLVLPCDDSLALVASTGFAVLRFENAEAAAFYHSFLRSDAATQQLMRWNSGATYPAIENDVPLRIRAPRFDDEVVRRKGRRWLTKFSALSASRGLTVVATSLVENLIDGHITEAELVAAQKALEAGDRSADREILKSLRQSDAPNAMPLIADVDALYSLLDGSEGQDP